jgi:hypothetical protein
VNLCCCCCCCCCSSVSTSAAAAPSNLGVLQRVVEVDPGMDDPYGMQRVSVDRCAQLQLTEQCRGTCSVLSDAPGLAWPKALTQFSCCIDATLDGYVAHAASPQGLLQ